MQVEGVNNLSVLATERQCKRERSVGYGRLLTDRQMYRLYIDLGQSCLDGRGSDKGGYNPAYRLEDGSARLGSSVLRFHIVQIVIIVLTLIVILRDASQIARTSDRGRTKRTSATKPIALRERHIVGTSNDTAIVRHAGARILRDDGRSITVRASFATVCAASHTRTVRTGRVEHRQTG